MQQSMKDYRVQMALADDIAGAYIALAVAGNIGALGRLAAATASLPIGISQTIVSVGAFGGVIALAAAGIAAEVVAVAASHRGSCKG
ncbi:MAG: hypothetical protein ACI9CE_001250 [Flavobacterium sp.]|jgi:hypothetical protein